MSGSTREFVDRVTVSIDLVIAGRTFSFAGGDVKAFSLIIEPHGFTGRAEMWFVAVGAQEDELFESFVARDLIEVSMSLQRAHDQVFEVATPMHVKGLVTQKSVVERAFGTVEGAPILQRRYVIDFADRASVAWSQHRPTALYVNQSLEDVITKHVPAGVTLSFSLAPFAEKRPVLSVGLGVDRNDASFLDYLFWLLNRYHGGLVHDGETDTYGIMGAKPDTGAAYELPRAGVASIEIVFPPLRRDSLAVLNAFTDAATAAVSVANEHGIAGVRTDWLIRSPIESTIENRKTLEIARAAQREPELCVALAAFPTTPLRPSMKVKLGVTFSANMYPFGAEYRVRRALISACATNEEPTDANNDASNAYRMQYEAQMELASDPAFCAPAFQRPMWPFYMEGKVLSEIGAAEEGTYQSYEAEGTSLPNYKINVPLCTDGPVIVPFEPAFFSGHFYFPAYKDERVLLSLDFDEARIASFLDWRPGARLPLDTQGNHLLLGKKDKDETSIRHVYEDAKPKLSIQRTKDADVQIITISEGTIRLETFETKDGA